MTSVTVIHPLLTNTLICVSAAARDRPSYLADELEYTADFEAQRRLQSASSLSLNVRRTRLSSVGDRAFPVAAAVLGTVCRNISKVSK